MRILAILIFATSLLGCSGVSTMPTGFNEACYGGDYNKNLLGAKPVYSATLTIDQPSHAALRDLLFRLAKRHDLTVFDEGERYNHAFFNIYMCSPAGAFVSVDSRSAGQNSMDIDVFSYKASWRSEEFLHDFRAALLNRWPDGLKQRSPSNTTLRNSTL